MIRAPQLWLGLLTLAGIVLVVPSLFCCCGYLGVEGLVVTGFFALLAWGCFLTNTCASLPLRFFLAVLTILASMIVIKAVVDVFWVGHEPVFA